MARRRKKATGGGGKRKAKAKRKPDKFKEFRKREYRCPVHRNSANSRGVFVGFEWLGHTRWCKASQKGDIVSKKKETKANDVYALGVQTADIVIRNGKKEISVATVAYSNERQLVRLIRQGLKTGLAEKK